MMTDSPLTRGIVCEADKIGLRYYRPNNNLTLFMKVLFGKHWNGKHTNFDITIKTNWPWYAKIFW